MSISISNSTADNIPKIDFNKIKEAIIGADHELSLAFVGAEEIRKLNRTYRNIDKPTDILSFPISDKIGEIYICIDEARREAPKFDRKFDNFIAFLFIHGCTHLKGYDHSDKMEQLETKYREQFGV